MNIGDLESLARVASHYTPDPQDGDDVKAIIAFHRLQKVASPETILKLIAVAKRKKSLLC